MKLTRIFLPTLVFLLANSFLVSANLEVLPSTVNADVYSNEPFFVNLTIKNNFNMTFYNLTFTAPDYIELPVINELKSGESKLIEMKILTQSQFSTAITPILRGNYLIFIDFTPVTHSINILHNSYQPSNLEIHQGDSIKYFNSDTISHSATCSYFDHTLAPSEYWTTQPLNNIGQIDVWDKSLLFHGYLNVINKTKEELAHNDAYNSQFSINLNSFYRQSDFSFDLIDTNLTVEADSTKSGLLKLINSGNETIINMSLTSDYVWIDFLENQFNLQQNEQNYVEFLISPLITQTNDTGKNYTIQLKAKGTNTGEITRNLEIYVPYKELQDINLSDREATIRELKRLVEIIAQLNLDETGINETIIYKDLEFQYNLSGREIDKVLTDITGLKDDFGRISGNMVVILDYLENKLKADMENLTLTTQESILIAEENKKTIDFRNTMTAVITIFVLVIILLSSLLYYFNRKRKKEKGMFG